MQSRQNRNVELGSNIERLTSRLFATIPQLKRSSLIRLVIWQLLFACGLGLHAFAQIAAPTNPDNILTPADPIGTPPGVATDGTNESVGLSDGALTVYIPLLSIPQLGGWSLPFAFIHSSNGYYLQQNVTASPQDADTDGESKYLSSLV
jgi:hypothetical protein